MNEQEEEKDILPENQIVEEAKDEEGFAQEEKLDQIPIDFIQPESDSHVEEVPIEQEQQEQEQQQEIEGKGGQQDGSNFLEESEKVVEKPVSEKSSLELNEDDQKAEDEPRKIDEVEKADDNLIDYSNLDQSYDEIQSEEVKNILKQIAELAKADIKHREFFSLVSQDIYEQAITSHGREIKENFTNHPFYQLLHNSDIESAKYQECISACEYEYGIESEESRLDGNITRPKSYAKRISELNQNEGPQALIRLRKYLLKGIRDLAAYQSDCKQIQNQMGLTKSMAMIHNLTNMFVQNQSNSTPWYERACHSQSEMDKVFCGNEVQMWSSSMQIRTMAESKKSYAVKENSLILSNIERVSLPTNNLYQSREIQLGIKSQQGRRQDLGINYSLSISFNNLQDARDFNLKDCEIFADQQISKFNSIIETSIQEFKNKGNQLFRNWERKLEFDLTQASLCEASLTFQQYLELERENSKENQISCTKISPPDQNFSEKSKVYVDKYLGQKYKSTVLDDCELRLPCLRNSLKQNAYAMLQSLKLSSFQLSAFPGLKSLIGNEALSQDRFNQLISSANSASSNLEGLFSSLLSQTFSTDFLQLKSTPKRYLINKFLSTSLAESGSLLMIESEKGRMDIIGKDQLDLKYQTQVLGTYFHQFMGCLAWNGGYLAAYDKVLYRYNEHFAINGSIELRDDITSFIQISPTCFLVAQYQAYLSLVNVDELVVIYETCLRSVWGRSIQDVKYVGLVNENQEFCFASKRGVRFGQIINDEIQVTDDEVYLNYKEIDSVLIRDKVMVLALVKQEQLCVINREQRCVSNILFSPSQGEKLLCLKALPNYHTQQFAYAMVRSNTSLYLMDLKDFKIIKLLGDRPCSFDKSYRKNVLAFRMLPKCGLDIYLLQSENSKNTLIQAYQMTQADLDLMRLHHTSNNLLSIPMKQSDQNQCRSQSMKEQARFLSSCKQVENDFISCNSCCLDQSKYTEFIDLGAYALLQDQNGDIFIIETNNFSIYDVIHAICNGQMTSGIASEGFLYIGIDCQIIKYSFWRKKVVKQINCSNQVLSLLKNDSFLLAGLSNAVIEFFTLASLKSKNRFQMEDWGAYAQNIQQTILDEKEFMFCTGKGLRFGMIESINFIESKEEAYLIEEEIQAAYQWETSVLACLLGDPRLYLIDRVNKQIAKIITNVNLNSRPFQIIGFRELDYPQFVSLIKRDPYSIKFQADEEEQPEEEEQKEGEVKTNEPNMNATMCFEDQQHEQEQDQMRGAQPTWGEESEVPQRDNLFQTIESIQTPNRLKGSINNENGEVNEFPIKQVEIQETELKEEDKEEIAENIDLLPDQTQENNEAEAINQEEVAQIDHEKAVPHQQVVVNEGEDVKKEEVENEVKALNEEEVNNGLRPNIVEPPSELGLIEEKQRVELDQENEQLPIKVDLITNEENKNNEEQNNELEYPNQTEEKLEIQEEEPSQQDGFVSDAVSQSNLVLNQSQKLSEEEIHKSQGNDGEECDQLQTLDEEKSYQNEFVKYKELQDLLFIVDQEEIKAYSIQSFESIRLLKNLQIQSLLLGASIKPVSGKLEFRVCSQLETQASLNLSKFRYERILKLLSTPLVHQPVFPVFNQSPQKNQQILKNKIDLLIKGKVCDFSSSENQIFYNDESSGITILSKENLSLINRIQLQNEDQSEEKSLAFVLDVESSLLVFCNRTIYKYFSDSLELSGQVYLEKETFAAIHINSGTLMLSSYPNDISIVDIEKLELRGTIYCGFNIYHFQRCSSHEDDLIMGTDSGIRFGRLYENKYFRESLKEFYLEGKLITSVAQIKINQLLASVWNEKVLTIIDRMRQQVIRVVENPSQSNFVLQIISLSPGGDMSDSEFVFVRDTEGISVIDLDGKGRESVLVKSKQQQGLRRGRHGLVPEKLMGKKVELSAQKEEITMLLLDHSNDETRVVRVDYEYLGFKSLIRKGYW